MSLPEEVLDIDIYSGRFQGPLRDYLKELLIQLIIQGEGFSGKRPLGYSGWAYPIYEALIDDGYVPGKLDVRGNVEECDIAAVDKLLGQLIADYPL